MSKEVFSYVKLKDVAEIEISSVDKKIIENETEVFLCNFVDVYYNWAVTKNKAKSFMKATAKQSEIDRFSIKKGQVAITKDSETKYDIGVATYIADDFENVILGYHCALITPDENKLSGRYLNAFLHTQFAQKYFELNATGSGQRFTLSLDTIKDMPLYLPTLEKQKEIAGIFSKIDKKIELNEVINHNLEKQAKQLYDYWFVQYDFPNSDGEPYKLSGGVFVYNEHLKREIPEKWVAKTLNTIEPKIITGKTPSTKDVDNYNGEIPFITIGDIRNNTYVVSTAQSLSIKGANSQSSKYLPAGAICVTCIATPGLVGFTTETSQTNQQINSVICSKEYHKEYLYFALKHYFEYSSGAKTGNTFANMNKEEFSSILLPYSEGTIVAFSKKVKMLFEQIRNLSFENRLLLQLREYLLPVLMNGQIKVTD